MTDGFAVARCQAKSVIGVMNRGTAEAALGLVIALALLAGCGTAPIPPPLNNKNINLIFVVSEDLAFQAPGDVNPTTANLTNQGLQRSLLMATFLQQQVLGSNNVTAIYALEPTTHPQTANSYPDMAAPETIQQFALLNQIVLSTEPTIWVPFAGHSYPINVSSPSQGCPNCQGLDFADQNGDNEALVTRIIEANRPGFYVFSAPWETTSAMLANIKNLRDYNLTVPGSYQGPNTIYALSIAPSGGATMVSYDSHANPLSTYPVLPPPKLVPSACTTQAPFSITVVGGKGGAVVPAGINTDETVYFIRHADAHPRRFWNDNNYVGAGQWRALDLPNALLGKMSPEMVYSIDPGQFGPGSPGPTGELNYSAVAPALTGEPYAIANSLPYNLVTSFQISDTNAAAEARDFFFFNGPGLSHHKLLVAWVYQQIAPTVNSLLATYHGDNQPAPDWPDTDYDSIWTLTIDANGNVNVNNLTCEGINSSALPATPPQF